MTDAPTPQNDPHPGLGRVAIPLPEHLADDGNLLLEPDQVEALCTALSDAQDARLHLGAVLGVLQKCPQQHPIPAGLYVGNLLPIHERMVRVIAGLEKMLEGCV
jgi:hypothetical protein